MQSAPLMAQCGTNWTMGCCKVACQNTNVNMPRPGARRGGGHRESQPPRSSFGGSPGSHLGLAQKEIGQAGHGPLGCMVWDREDARCLIEVQTQCTKEETEGNNVQLQPGAVQKGMGEHHLPFRLAEGLGCQHGQV